MYAMNQNYPPGGGADPSMQVPPQVLPHVHLVSTYRFPQLQNLPPQPALEYLIKGPTIVKDTSPVAWTYFPSPPPDGTVLLTWQPPRLGTNFASDGLVWADPEMVYDMQIRGYNLQVLIHKSGYFYPKESYTTHARYRYRITQGPGHIDPNLWIVHYSMAEPQSRIPANQIPMHQEIQAIIQMRAQLEGAGQLVRKEFMLADRANWPKVEFAPRGGPQQPPFYNPMQPHRYANQGPPAKRQRQNQPRQPIAAAAAADTSLEDEENSTQDTFDFMTPREISLSRYRQHHEWMEEIFSSPYAVGKILPVDLGLGLMGELAPLTDGILDAPTGDHPQTGHERDLALLSSDKDKKEKEYSVKSYFKLTSGQLNDFERRVAEYTKKEQAELEKLEAAHAKKMAALKRSKTYVKAERRLRDVPRSDNASPQDDADPAEPILRDLEKSLGVEFDTKPSVVCVDKGGFIEEQQAPAQKVQQANGNNATNSNADTGSSGLIDTLDADNSAAGLLDQYGSGSLTGTPGTNLSIPQIPQSLSQSESAVATPSAPAADINQSSFDEQANIDATSAANDLLDLDVEMSGMTNAEEKGEDGGWVVVDPPGTAQQTSSAPQPATGTSAPTEGTAPTSGAETDATAGIFDAADFGSFDNLDTAGDALADYTNVDDNMGLDLVDDSAFGDAFHPTEMQHGETAEDNA